MCSVRLTPATLLYRFILFAGLFALSAITLQDRGASLMYAFPWTLCYWGTLLSPALLLIVRLRNTSQPLRLPTESWLWLLTAACVVLLVAAVTSPYRAICLQWTALPMAGLATFLLIYDWLQASPENHIKLAHGSALAAGIIVALGNIYWAMDFPHFSREQFFSMDWLEVRNAHPLGHANYTAGLVLLGLPWLVRSVFNQRGLIRVLAAVATALATLMLFSSGSRGGLLGIAVLGISTLFTANLNRKRFFLFAGLAIAGPVLLAIANPRIRAMLGPPDALAETNLSTVQRAAMLKAGVLMAQARPLLGWGPGSTPLAFPRFRHRLEGGAENVLQLHNTPLEILAGTGSGGLLVCTVFLVLAFRNASRAPGAAISLAGYTVFSLTDYQLDIPVFVLALAALAAQLAAPRPRSNPVRWRRGLTFATMTIVVLIAMAGRRDPTPQLNAEALLTARDPAQTLKAVAQLDYSLALNPDQEIAHFNLGWLLLVSDPKSAEQHFRQAAFLVPDKGGVYFGLALARLNQGTHDGVARALAVECLNEPQFLSSPWWNTPEIAAERAATAGLYVQLVRELLNSRRLGDWAGQQAASLGTLAPKLGLVSAGLEKNYRRERIGYPVLMRNLDIAPPLDLYDVREDPRFASSVSFPLPHKGWLPSPLLLRLLNDSLTKN